MSNESDENERRARKIRLATEHTRTGYDSSTGALTTLSALDEDGFEEPDRVMFEAAVINNLNTAITHLSQALRVMLRG